MSFQLPQPDESLVPPQIGIVSTLHRELLVALTEMVGDSVRVRASQSAEDGLVSYGFAAGACDIVVHVQPYTEEAAILRAEVLIGRVVHGYRRALRWLACNRAANTVAIAVSEEILARRELRLSYARITAPGDPFTIAAQLADIIEESTRTAGILNAWFQQLIVGTWLIRVSGNIGNADEAAYFRDVTTRPREVLRACEERDGDAWVRAQLARFAGDWKKLWTHACDFERVAAASGDTDELFCALNQQMTACYQLGRYEQAMAIVERIVNELGCGDQGDRNASAVAACLVRLGRYREALDAIATAPHPDDPRLIFWSACACFGLGERSDGNAAYDRYTGLCGPDIEGDKIIRSIIATEEKPIEPISFGDEAEDEK